LALADYIPESESATWTETDLLFVAGQLVTANAEFQPLLRLYLQPISQRLIPDLEQLFGDPQASDAQRLSAANAFADYAASDIGILSSLLTVATPEQYAVIYPLVAANPTPSSIDDLGKIAATMPPDVMGSVERIPFGQRRANAAVTLLRLGEREKVLSLFDWSDDPEALTQFIFRCRPRGIGVEPLLDLLELVAASEHRYPRDTRYVLMLAIGEFTPSEIPEARRVALVEQLADWYANDPSSGVHGAAGWLLRHLGEEEIVTRVDQTPVPYSADREWFTLAVLVTPTQPPKPQDKSPEELPKEDQDQQAEDTAETGKTPNVETTNENASEKSDLASEVKQLAGEERTETTVPVTDHEPDSSLSVETTICAPDTPSLPPKIFYYTFIVFPAGEYKISSPEDEPDRIKQAGQELQHIVRLTRPFAILDREMTYEEIISFKPKPYGDWLREDGRPASDPCDGVDWYDSVAFCRWLGQQIGLAEVEQAYPSPESLDLEKYPREPSPDANWAPRDWPLDLDRLGFRLPTDVEWEVATRGGSRTAYGFGGEVAVLQHFGWFRENSGQRVHATKELRPSIRGLFDLHGNLFEWTHDWYQGYSDNLTIDPLTTTGGQLRVLRGGSWAGVAAFCRSAHRPAIVPTVRATSYGFRLALSPSSQGQVPAEPEPAIGR
jgi:formylglycine-generating enzyme required for sulfatase activity